MTGGSTTPDQYSMALSSMHLCFYCLHAKLVDQFVGQGFSNPGAVLLDADVMARAAQLGKNVAKQMGESFDDAEYLGAITPSSCPNCHLSALEMFNTAENEVGCPTCGTRGRLVARSDGSILPEWEQDSIWSCLTMRGKIKHAEDILSWGATEKPKMAALQDEKQRWFSLDIAAVALPSDAVRDKISPDGVIR